MHICACKQMYFGVVLLEFWGFCFAVVCVFLFCFCFCFGYIFVFVFVLLGFF